MSGRFTALIGVMGAAALGLWMNVKKSRRDAQRDVQYIDTPSIPAAMGNSRSLTGGELDDDSAADIIRRARPALERARNLN